MPARNVVILESAIDGKNGYLLNGTDIPFTRMRMA